MNEMNEYLSVGLKDFSYSFKKEVNYFREYLRFNEERIDDWKKQLDEKLEIDKQEDPECEQWLEDIYCIDYLKVPSYFYHSSIVTLYSLLETKLNDICRIIRQKTELVIGLKDMAGSNIIEKSKKFLIFFAEIDFEIIQGDWKRITDFQKLRNIIIHHNFLTEEVVYDGKEKVHKTIELFNSIKYIDNTNEFYVVDLSIPDEFLLLVERFILEIIDQVSVREFPIQKGVNKPRDYDDLPF